MPSGENLDDSVGNGGSVDEGMSGALLSSKIILSFVAGRADTENTTVFC